MSAFRCDQTLPESQLLTPKETFPIRPVPTRPPRSAIRGIEPPRILQKGKTACVGQDQQPRVRDHRRDIFGVLTLDRLVMVAVGDENWRVDRLELRIAPIGLFGPHL